MQAATALETGQERHTNDPECEVPAQLSAVEPPPQNLRLP